MLYCAVRCFLRRVRSAAAPIAFLWVANCAGFDIKTIRLPADEASARGFRYYESAPFLFVHSDGKSGLTGEIVFLPDTTRQRSIRPYATWASNDATLMFTNGVLTQAKEDVDQTQVAAAALDGLTKVLSTAGLNA